jgi:hypothetical protein
MLFPSPLRVAFHGPLDTRGIGSFETFICRACGFTEWYAHGFEHLRADADEGIQVIDARPPSTGSAYRDSARECPSDDVSRRE